MTYREFAPPAALASTVRRVWTFAADFGRAHHDERIAPDGSPELIFHFGTPYRERDAAGRWRSQPRALFAGNLTRPLLLRSTGRVGVLGVRLWPHAAGRFVAGPVSATLDARIALDAGCGKELVAALARLHDAPTRDDVLAAASALVARLSRAGFEPDAIAAATVHSIFAARGQGQVETWARAAGLSARQLERRVVAATGLSPKLLASLVRFHAVFDEIKPGAPSAWLAAAIESGYFDQAHMVRDFRRFTGQPPRAYLRSAGLLSAALVEPDAGR
ncbi:MAG: AraC family transcriptional regulator [Betaproteobacteria bacterium]|nr:AraC family transcriptional regulator [Betaproteobacteria bacterium]